MENNIHGLPTLQMKFEHPWQLSKSKEVQHELLGCPTLVLQFVTSCCSKSPMACHQLQFELYQL